MEFENKWIEKTKKGLLEKLQCPYCGFTYSPHGYCDGTTDDPYNYCPECGKRLYEDYVPEPVFEELEEEQE